MTTRAKFTVVSITRQQGWAGHKEIQTVRLQPVTGNSEENKRFYAATPGGAIELSAIPEAVGAEFDIGDEFYVDFTKANRDG